MSSYNIYSGTPKKTLDLVRNFKEDTVIYVYNNKYSEYKSLYEAAGAKVYRGDFGRNIFKHVFKLKKVLKDEKIDIVQTQFSMGEFLGFLIKLLNPKIKLIIAFVGALAPKNNHRFILNRIYKKANHIVYISDYVKSQKETHFPILSQKNSTIIYNGTKKREDNGEAVINMKGYSVLAVSGLIELKNIQILLEAFSHLINKNGIMDVFLYIAGDGPIKEKLESLIEKYALQEHVYLLGYQKNIGRLINECDLFVHPSYNEGFGIAVAEAMIGEKPIIVANAGALPELIENEKTGLVVDPFISKEWVDAILKYKNDKIFVRTMATNAKNKAKSKFSSESFINNYETLYTKLVLKK